jgi:hypothetical protein
MSADATRWRVEASTKGTAFVVVRNPQPGFAQYLNARGEPSGKASKFRTNEAARRALATHAIANATAHTAESPTIRMQPRDETAARLEFERAKRLVESHGRTVTAPDGVGCEGVATAAIPDDEERRLQIAHYRTEFQQIAEWASNCARSSSADPADWRADMVAMSERLTRRLSV